MLRYFLIYRLVGCNIAIMKSLINLFIFLIVFFYQEATAQLQKVGFNDVDDISNILPVRERYQYMNEVVDWRLKNLLPRLMIKHNIDVWIISYRENVIDPVAATFGQFGANVFLGSSFLIHNLGGDKGIKQYPLRTGYPVYYGKLKDLIEKLDPNTIGINTSEIWNNGDGLTKTLYEKIEDALEEYSDRLVSAENLSNEWLEVKTKRELTVYRHVVGVAHDVISEAFSNKVIVPGITTADDLSWWIAQRYADLGLNGLYYIIELQRSPKDRKRYGNPEVTQGFKDNSKLEGDVVIQRGDIIHSDVGMEYMGLNTDQQHHVYILRDGETDAPEGLKEALKRSNRLQDIFMGAFVEERSGNDITRFTHVQSDKEGLKSMIYTHPIGYHQHSGGTIMGADSDFAQRNKLPKAEYGLQNNTVWSIELETISEIPEWDNIEVEISVEEQGAFTKERGAYFIDGRQTKWFLVY